MVIRESELYHHGILGQRWGVRRYQNKDGTLTPAGRKRADKLRNQYLSLTGNTQLRGDNHKQSKHTEQHTKSVHEMSNEELQNAINRKRLEQQYAQLNPQKVSAGKKFIDKIVVPAVQDAGKKIATDLIDRELRKALNLPKNNDGGKKKKKK